MTLCFSLSALRILTLTFVLFCHFTHNISHHLFEVILFGTPNFLNLIYVFFLNFEHSWSLFLQIRAFTLSLSTSGTSVMKIMFL